jgi:hypothetical protein
MYIGTIEANWAHVGIVAWWLLFKRYFISNEHFIGDGYRRAASTYEARQASGSSIHTLMAFYPSEATDSRDKLSALLGLTKEVEQSHSLLRPDYTKAVDQVYMDIVRHMIKANSNIVNLSWAFWHASLSNGSSRV